MRAIRVDRSGPRAAGRKALARNLSDVAAMAAQPLCATATVSLPKTFSDADAQAICEGLWDIAAQFNCPVVGGDVAIADGPLVVSVTVLARPEGIEPVLRAGARPGDALCVTGTLGGAWKTGRDLTFTPRIVAARALAECCDLHAMIDLSDGLATDLRHLRGQQPRRGEKGNSVEKHCAASKVRENKPRQYEYTDVHVGRLNTQEDEVGPRVRLRDAAQKRPNQGCTK